MLRAVNEAHLSVVGGHQLHLLCQESGEWLEEAACKREAQDGRQKLPQETVEPRTSKPLAVPSKVLQIKNKNKKQKTRPKEGVGLASSLSKYAAVPEQESALQNSRQLFSPHRHTWPNFYLARGWRRYSEQLENKISQFCSLCSHSFFKILFVPLEPQNRSDHIHSPIR